MSLYTRYYRVFVGSASFAHSWSAGTFSGPDLLKGSEGACFAAILCYCILLTLGFGARGCYLTVLGTHSSDSFRACCGTLVAFSILWCPGSALVSSIV